MNMFPGFKFSSKVALHNVSMFSNLFAVYCYLFIFMGRLSKRFKSEIGIFRQMNFSEAFSRTIFDVSIFKTILPYIKFNETVLANNIFTCFWFFTRYSSSSEIIGLTGSGAIYGCRFSFLKRIITKQTYAEFFGPHEERLTYSDVYCKSNVRDYKRKK